MLALFKYCFDKKEPDLKKIFGKDRAMKFIPYICILCCVAMCLPRMELYTNHGVGSAYIRTEEFAN